MGDSARKKQKRRTSDAQSSTHQARCHPSPPPYITLVAAKRAFAFPNLERSKAAILKSLTSESGQRTYDHAITEFVDWYCAEPRLAFNGTVVQRHRIYLA